MVLWYHKMKNNPRRAIIIVLIGFLLFVISGCSSPKLTYQTLSAQQAYSLLQSQKDIVLLDVRTLSEHQQIRIPGSILIPLDSLTNQVEQVIVDKETVILVYCRTGNRSKEAAEILVRLGYKNVSDIGGIVSWPYETE